MLSAEEYREYAQSNHIQQITKWMKHVVISEKEGEEVEPPALYDSIAIRDYIMFQYSWFELLRSSNIIHLTMYDWNNRKTYEELGPCDIANLENSKLLEDSVFMVNSQYKTSDKYGDKVKL